MLLKELNEHLTFQTAGESFLTAFKECQTVDSWEGYFLQLADKDGSLRLINQSLVQFFDLLSTMQQLSTLGGVDSRLGLEELKQFLLKKQAVFLKEKDVFEKAQAEELKRKQVAELIQKINTDFLPYNKLEELKDALDYLLKLDAEGLNLIPLKQKIEKDLELFKSNLLAKNYEASANTLNFLSRIKKTLGSFFEKFRVNFSLADLEKEIFNNVSGLYTATIIEVRQQLSDNHLKGKNFSLGNIKQFGDFYLVVDKFKLVEGVGDFRKEMTKALVTNLNVIFQQYTKNFSPDYFTNLLLMTSFIAQEIGPRDASLSLEIKKYLGKIISDMDKVNKDGMSAVCTLLMAMSEDPALSQYASTLISDYPVFKGALVAKYKSKTSKRNSAHILSEIRSEDTRKLEQCYRFFDERYGSILEEVITGFTSENPRNVRNKTVLAAKSLASDLSGTTNFHAKPEKIAHLVAAIFGVLSYMDAAGNEDSRNFKTDRASIFEPHASQVLSIFLLLGMDTSSTLKNHLLQVKTGEGKSIVVSVAAAVLGLMGYTVDVVCYNPYLAHRDEKTAIPLFKALEIATLVSYFDFRGLCNKRLAELNLRGLVSDFVKGKSTNVVKVKDQKNILMIDEVDVFFGEAFMGNVYCPITQYASLDYKAFLIEVWDKKEKYTMMSFQDFSAELQKHDRLLSFFEEHPNARPFLAIFLKKVFDGLSNVSSGQHNYYCRDGRIGYLNESSGSINYHSIDGQSTAFAAIKEYRLGKGKIPETYLDEALAPGVSCGEFSYAELPLTYQHVVGVTGTLFSLSDFEKGLLRNYDIEKRTAVPSVFEKKIDGGLSNVKICGGTIDARDENGYFDNIKKQVLLYISKDRAVLLIFETKDRLESYRNFIINSPYGLKSLKTNKLTAETPESERTQIIGEAATRGRVTEMTRDFGRGSDFVCHDSQLKTAGGVAVICTFFPDHEAEEVQIRGRTNRQDDPGNVDFILYLDDLKEKYSVASQVELQEASNVYSALDQKRKTYQATKTAGIEKKIADAKENHDKTMKLVGLLSKPSFFSSTASPSAVDIREATDLIKSFM